MEFHLNLNNIMRNRFTYNNIHNINWVEWDRFGLILLMELVCSFIYIFIDFSINYFIYIMVSWLVLVVEYTPLGRVFGRCINTNSKLSHTNAICVFAFLRNLYLLWSKSYMINGYTIQQNASHVSARSMTGC